jgi:hypothetical protein
MQRLAILLFEPLSDELKAKVFTVSQQRAQWYNETDEKALFDGVERAIAPRF